MRGVAPLKLLRLRQLTKVQAYRVMIQAFHRELGAIEQALANTQGYDHQDLHSCVHCFLGSDLGLQDGVVPVHSWHKPKQNDAICGP